MNPPRSAEVTTTVSVLGLGMLGASVARAFLDHGHPTTVWNRSSTKADELVRRGAVRAAAADGAVAASPLVVVCVSDYAAGRSVLGAAGESLRGRVLVNLSSGTPQAARELADQMEQRGVGYLDAAAMSGTRLVGQPRALTLFSGSSEAFDQHEKVLGSLGQSTYLGPDPGLASLYDTALFGMAWGALGGFFHSVALVGAEKVEPTAFAAVAIAHFPFVTQLMLDHARQIEQRRYGGDDGTIEVHAAAMQHLVDTSRALGVAADLPELLQKLLDRSIAAGHAHAGIASAIEVIMSSSGKLGAPERGRP